MQITISDRLGNAAFTMDFTLFEGWRPKQGGKKYGTVDLHIHNDNFLPVDDDGNEMWDARQAVYLDLDRFELLQLRAAIDHCLAITDV